MNPKQFREALKREYNRGIKSSPEGEFERFRKTWEEFWDKSGNHVGDILISHLCVEYYLEMYLLAANGRLGKLDKVRLTFAQKLQLARGTKLNVIEEFAGGFRALNSVRNKLVHNIRAEITDSDLAPMRELAVAFYEVRGRASPKGLEVVKAFAAMASMYLHGAAMIEGGKRPINE